MDIRSSVAARNYAAHRNLAGVARPENSKGFLGEQIANFADALKETDKQALAAMTGTGDTQSLVRAIAESELAVEMAVSVRNKVVEAYQEILRMPV